MLRAKSANMTGNIKLKNVGQALRNIIFPQNLANENILWRLIMLELELPGD
jgi:hypothetical protein